MSPNPPDVAVTSIVVLHPQSEQQPFIAIVDFSGLPSNIFLIISTITKYQSFQEASDDDPHILSKIQAEITGFFPIYNFIGFQKKGQGDLIGTKCVVKIPIILRVHCNQFNKIVQRFYETRLCRSV